MKFDKLGNVTSCCRLNTAECDLNDWNENAIQWLLMFGKGYNKVEGVHFLNDKKQTPSKA